jgi:hydroxypyruvate isomerase
MNLIHRRQILAGAAAVSGALVLPGFQDDKKVVKIGRLKQSASRWCYGKIPFSEFCKAVAGIGLTAIDLLKTEDWEKVREYGLVCSMGTPEGGGIADGMNDKKNHERILKGLEKALPMAAKHGVPNVIAMFGNRKGIRDEAGTENCIEALNKIKALAEEQRVMIAVEVLNSKIDHKDYQGDRTPFALNIIKAVNSPNVKILFDIYHMQIMEGDIIRTIQANKDYLCHFHTGGVPGRHELDDTQELNWRAVCKAIADTGFKGYVAHEFVPTRDPLTSLREAVALCDV